MKKSLVLGMLILLCFSAYSDNRKKILVIESYSSEYQKMANLALEKYLSIKPEIVIISNEANNLKKVNTF
jgi:hypothetical protein